MGIPPAASPFFASSMAVEGGSRRLCGQLYCLRANVARNLYLPRDLGANDAGFIDEMA